MSGCGDWGLRCPVCFGGKFATKPWCPTCAREIKALGEHDIMALEAQAVALRLKLARVEAALGVTNTPR